MVAALAVAALAVAVIMSVAVIATDGTVTAWCVAFFPVAVVLAGSQRCSCNSGVDGDGDRIEDEFHWTVAARCVVVIV